MPNQLSKRSSLGVLVFASLSTAAITFGGSAAAQVSQSASSPRVAQVADVSLVVLEETFWVCDYVATVRRIAEDRTAVCVAVYDELKQRKFGGDLDHLVRWWQQNKPAQHARLSAIDRPQQ